MKAVFRTRHSLCVFLALLLSAVLLAGCSNEPVSNPADTGSKSPPSDNGASVSDSGSGEGDVSSAGDITIGVLPKFLNDPFFVAVRQGAEEAAAELGINLDFNGPVNLNVVEQSEFIDRWIEAGYDAIAVSAGDPDALVPAMKRAAEAGIGISTWDADVSADGREVFVNQVSPSDFAATLVESIAAQSGGEGEYLLLTSELTAPNQSSWIDEIYAYAEETYPNMSFPSVLATQEDLATARDLTMNYIRSHPDTKGIISVSGNATAGAAEGLEQLGLGGQIPITGLAVPSLLRQYVESGTIQEHVTWNAPGVGYAAVYVAYAQATGSFDSTSGSFECGKLGTMSFSSDDVISMGSAGFIVINAENTNDYEF